MEIFCQLLKYSPRTFADKLAHYTIAPNFRLKQNGNEAAKKGLTAPTKMDILELLNYALWNIRNCSLLRKLYGLIVSKVNWSSFSVFFCRRGKLLFFVASFLHLGRRLKTNLRFRLTSVALEGIAFRLDRASSQKRKNERNCTEVLVSLGWLTVVHGGLESRLDFFHGIDFYGLHIVISCWSYFPCGLLMCFCPFFLFLFLLQTTENVHAVWAVWPAPTMEASAATDQPAFILGGRRGKL